jgi:hypothetical protein
MGVSGISAGVIAVATLLPGCGEGGSSGTTGPNAEVKIVQPTDKQGKPIGAETALPPVQK